MIGIKGAMTQIFDAEGNVRAATIITAGPLTVTQLKTQESDGYQAVQLGFGNKKEKHSTKPERGHTKELGVFRALKEVQTTEAFTRGQVVDLSVFTPGDMVSVSAVSKAKGFQGVVKRHGFSGDMRSHGRKHSERAPGSIGGGGRAGGRVIKGMRMAGRMGGDRVTVRNLQVLQVNTDTGTLVISGAVPGRPGTLVEISAA